MTNVTGKKHQLKYRKRNNIKVGKYVFFIIIISIEFMGVVCEYCFRWLFFSSANFLSENVGKTPYNFSFFMLQKLIILLFTISANLYLNPNIVLQYFYGHFYNQNIYAAYIIYDSFFGSWIWIFCVCHLNNICYLH